jgi:hypothetical protein
MGTCFIRGELEYLSEDEIIATHIFTSFSDDLKGRLTWCGGTVGSAR